MQILLDWPHSTEVIRASTDEFAYHSDVYGLDYGLLVPNMCGDVVIQGETIKVAFVFDHLRDVLNCTRNPYPEPPAPVRNNRKNGSGR